MKLFIQNMVSLRCKMIVRAELEKMALQCVVVELGEVEVLGPMDAAQHRQLKTALHPYGLHLMDDQKAILIEKIKHVVIEMVQVLSNWLAVGSASHCI